MGLRTPFGIRNSELGTWDLELAPQASALDPLLVRYGHFDDRRREYVITRPDTPLPWINYLGCESYFGLISNTAGGYSFYRDARLRRLTRYRYNHAPFDVGGRYLYLRDRGTGEFWSPSWQPTRTKLARYRCRHGLGYTTIGSTFRGIDAETSYFVPLGETLEPRPPGVHVRQLRKARSAVQEDHRDLAGFPAGRDVHIGDLRAGGKVPELNALRGKFGGPVVPGAAAAKDDKRNAQESSPD